MDKEAGKGKEERGGGKKKKEEEEKKEKEKHMRVYVCAYHELFDVSASAAG